MIISITLLILASYLVGSIPTAYIVGRLAKGIDIRKHGSGNVGASNVFRVIGKKWGTAVLAFDMLKGFIPAYFFPFFISADPKIIGLILGVAAIAGHNWPLFLNFKGGKGVATMAGVFLGILPKAVLAASVVWILVVLFTNYIAVGSMVAGFSTAIFICLFYRDIAGFKFLLSTSLLLAFLVVYMHRSNIDRLRKGIEHKVFKKKKPS